MTDRSLAEILREMSAADRVVLPVQPDLGQRILAGLADAVVDEAGVWSLVSRDPALLCALFRAANSSFFAGLQRTLLLEEAVTRLGRDRALQLVERACREGEGGLPGELFPRYMPRLWQHALGCALGARWLANRCGYQSLAEQAYLGGLLHDIGKQLLLAALQQIVAGGESGVVFSGQLVQEVLDSMHVEQGLRLFDAWNLPDLYKEVVANHHEPGLDKQHTVIALVKLADKGCRKLGLGLTQQADLVLPTTGEAQFLGIDEIALAELEIMLEDRFFAAGPDSSG